MTRVHLGTGRSAAAVLLPPGPPSHLACGAGSPTAHPPAPLPPRHCCLHRTAHQLGAALSVLAPSLEQQVEQAAFDGSSGDTAEAVRQLTAVCRAASICQRLLSIAGGEAWWGQVQLCRRSLPFLLGPGTAALVAAASAESAAGPQASGSLWKLIGESAVLTQLCAVAPLIRLPGLSSSQAAQLAPPRRLLAWLSAVVDLIGVLRPTRARGALASSPGHCHCYALPWQILAVPHAARHLSDLPADS